MQEMAEKMAGLSSVHNVVDESVEDLTKAGATHVSIKKDKSTGSGWPVM